MTDAIITINGLSDITVKLNRFRSDITSERILSLIAVKLKNNIFMRTSAGYDQNYAAFKAYNPKYAKKERKTIVNLTKTGGMLNSMSQKILSNDTVKIYFNNQRARKLADKHMNTAKKIRSFFGINAKDELVAGVLYDTEIKKALEVSKL